MLLLDACNDATFAAVMLFIKKLVSIICIITPVLLILLLTIDLTVGIVSNNEEKVQKVKTTGLKRIIFAIILLFVPTIVTSVNSFLGDHNVAFAECYSKTTDAYVDKLSDELKEETEEKQKKRDEEIKDIDKQRKAAEQERQKKAKKAAEKAKNSNNATNDKPGINNTTSTSEKIRNAKSYKSYHKLGTISSCKDSFSVSGGTVQAVAVTDKYYIISSHQGIVRVYDKKTQKKLKQFSKETGHGNGIAWNPNTNQVIITKSYSLRRTREYVYFSADNIGSRSKLNAKKAKFPVRAASIAYDKLLNQYYISARSLWVWAGPSQKNNKKTYSFTTSGGNRQDIGAYNGVIYTCRANTGSGNYIDLYKGSNGKYLGSYKINISGELEGIDYDTDSNRFVLAFHRPDEICILKKGALSIK